MATILVAAFVVNQTVTGEPIPNGWIAVGGALGLTVFTIAALRRFQRWSITDLESALARARVEVKVARTELDTERSAHTALRVQYVTQEEQVLVLRVAKAALTAENGALQTELARLRGS